MKLFRLVFTIALLAGIQGSLAFGQTQATMTEKELSRFIQDWPSVVQWLESKGKQFDSASAGQGVAAMFVDTEFTNFLRGKAWTVERFSYVAGSTFAIVAYIGFERQNPELIKEFDDAIKQVRADTSASEADKVAMIKSIEDTKRSMLSMAASADFNEAEIKLVRAKYDVLMKMIDG
jgi:hypothetical protein